MKVTMNHVAVMADDTRALADFYRDVIGLPPVVPPAAQDAKPEANKWLQLGDHELHVVQRDPDLAARLGSGVDPINAHFAFSVESAELRKELVQRLTEAGVKWVDWSPLGVPDKSRAFFLDPGNNLIEILVAGQQQ